MSARNISKYHFRFLGTAILALLAGLACKTVTGIREDVGTARSTAQAAATTVQQGKDLLATAQAFSTQVIGNEIVQTARAVATEGGSRLLATLQAAATESARRNSTQSAGDATSQVLATQRAPALEETARAFVTQQVPALESTAWAIATQAAFERQIPDDLPVVPQHKDNLLASADLMSYTTRLPFNDVLDFYEAQMPAYGWLRMDEASLVMDTSALLSFTQGSRKAVVNLAVDPVNGTLVVISIQPR